MRVEEFGVELLLEARAEVGEGAIWDAERQRLVWVDIPAGMIHTLDPESTRDDTYAAGQPVGAAALRAGGGLVLALRDGFGVLEDGAVRMLAAVEADRPDNRMNDGSVDAAGRFWAGTMELDMKPGAGALYRLDRDHSAHRVMAPMSVPNGIDWSPDGRTMYVVDSGAGGVDRFDFEPETAAISGRQRVCSLVATEGLPDGLTVDTDGFLWVAVWGAGTVRRYTPNGQLAAMVHIPTTQVTSSTFGGPGLDTLFITTAAKNVGDREPHAGAVFAARPGVTGRLPHQYHG